MGNFFASRAREEREEAKRLDREAAQHDRNGHPEDAAELRRQAEAARANAERLRRAGRGAR